MKISKIEELLMYLIDEKMWELNKKLEKSSLVAEMLAYEEQLSELECVMRMFNHKKIKLVEVEE